MDSVSTQPFVVANLNTHGTPLPSSQVKERFQAICKVFEQLPLNIINLQEVWSYGLLTILKKHLPSYRYIAYTHGLLGPRAGLVTLSRTPLHAIHCTPFPPVGEPRKKMLINRAKRILKEKGALVSLTQSMAVCNCHLVANGDGDWSRGNRYYPAHEHDIKQLVALIARLSSQQKDIVVTGDFNIPKCSDLYRQFVTLSLVKDVFERDETPTFHREFLPSGKQAHCVDYIYLRSTQWQPGKAVHFLQEKIVLANGEQHYASDHLGLLAELERVASHDNFN